jgi:peptidylprolyl isomerase
MPLRCTAVRRRLTVLLVAVAPFALPLTACGGGSSQDSSATASTSTAEATTAQPMPRPKVTVPKDPAPSQLVVKDLRKGTGVEAAAADTVMVNYVGVLYQNGKAFDASFDHGQPLQFPLGQGQVIPGWDRGLVGMRVGGRRELIIPPDLAYGNQAQSGIPAHSTLVFVVDLLGVS